MNGTRIISETEYTTLYYLITSLFDKAKMLSSYRARSIKTKEGEPQTDEYALTSDEQDFFDIIIRSAVKDVFTHFSVLSRDIEDAIQFKYDDLSSTSGIDESLSIVYIIEKPTYFDDNLTEILDQYVEDAIVSYVLKEWFKLKNLGEIYALEQASYESITGFIKNTINRRTKYASRPHRMM